MHSSMKCLEHKVYMWGYSPKKQALRNFGCVDIFSYVHPFSGKPLRKYTAQSCDPNVSRNFSRLVSRDEGDVYYSPSTHEYVVWLSNNDENKAIEKLIAAMTKRVSSEKAKLFDKLKEQRRVMEGVLKLKNLTLDATVDDQELSETLTSFLYGA